MQIEIHNGGKTFALSDLITRWLVNALSLVLVSKCVRGIDLLGNTGEQVLTVLVSSLVLGLMNAAIRPFLLILTLPINLLSLGLFTLVINGAILWMVSHLVRSFVIDSFGSAVLGALLLSLISMALNLIFKASGLSIRVRK